MKIESPTSFVMRRAISEEIPTSNRQLLIEVASERANLLGIDRVGNERYAENLADGTQVWARVRGDKIVNGGINREPRKRLPR